MIAGAGKSKIFLAFGNPITPRVTIPTGVEVILYDQVNSTVLVQYTDDIVAKLSANADSMARTSANMFQGIPIFNRELTLPSDIYQRVFLPGSTMPEFLFKSVNVGPFEKKISGFYTPGPASIVYPSDYVAIVSGGDPDLTAKVASFTSLSQVLSFLATQPTSGRAPFRCYVMMVGY